MTARRYSGSCTIYVELVEEQRLQIQGHPATYRCVVTDSGSKDRFDVMVGHPKHLVRAVDSPEAFDDAAHAAISFALNADTEDFVQVRHLDLEFHPSPKLDGSGYHVGRRPSDAHPPKDCDCIDCSVAGEPAH